MLFIYGILLLSACFLNQALVIEFSRHILVSPNKYAVAWGYTGTGPDDEITFQVEARTHGWVGLGFSPNGGMKDADIVVAGVDDSSGKGYLYDKHAKCNCFPQEDRQNNYKLLNASQNDTHTIVTFSRKLSTCDGEDFPITNDTVRLIWAMNQKDAVSADNFDKHESNDRGTKSVILLQDATPSVISLPSDVEPLELKLESVTIPSDYHTAYMCRFFKLPDLGKRHMVRHEPIIQKGHEPFLHHFVLYHCGLDVSHLADTQFPCYNESGVDNQMKLCNSKIIAVWAVGSDGVVLPGDMGFPLMEEGMSPYVMLQTHYDNSGYKKAPALDNSGIRLYLTSKLRKLELGQFTVGMGVSPQAMTIPPKQESTTLYAICDWRCTQVIPEDGINIISALLHEHLLGIGVRVRLIRSGVELPPIAEDVHYDFDYQVERMLKTPVKIYPNDTILVECTYNSKNKDVPTYGGHRTEDEMCFAFMMYYPKLENLPMCSSSPLPGTYAEAFGTEYNNDIPPTFKHMTDKSKNVTMVEFTKEYNWEAPGAIERYKNAIKDGNYWEFCGNPISKVKEEERSMGNGRPGLHTNVKIEFPQTEYVRPDPCGSRRGPVDVKTSATTDDCSLQANDKFADYCNILKKSCPTKEFCTFAGFKETCESTCCDILM